MSAFAPLLRQMVCALARLCVEALRYPQKAYELRDAHLVYLEQDPAFDALRSDPGFVASAKRMHLPEVKVN